MKKAFFALTAILAAGLASAITFDWTTTAVIAATSSATSATLGTSYQSAVNSDVGTTTLYGAIVSGSVPTSSTAVRDIFGVSDGTSNNSITVTITGDGTLSLFVNGNGNGSGTTLAATASGAYSSFADTRLVLAVTRPSDGASTLVTLYTSDTAGNLTELISGSTSSITTATLNSVYAVDYNGASGGALWGAVSSVAVYANETVLLPEPTVLALLALGVAGLALKRKSASR